MRSTWGKSKNGPGKYGPGKYGPACTIFVEILRELTIKLTRARARARARAMARALGLGLGLGSVFTFKRSDRFCRRTKFNVTRVPCVALDSGLCTNDGLCSMS